MRIKQSSKLVSMDKTSNKAHMKKTYLVELVPLCRDDLIVLPKKSAIKLGGLVLVTKVSSTVHLIQVY